jgi:hypothetical protein
MLGERAGVRDLPRVVTTMLILLATTAACANPTPAPTATPAPTPSSTPAPTPTPRPTAAPSPAPTAPGAPGGSATVPASIDATCSTGVGPAVNAWIASQPDGSTLVFPSGACYLFNGSQGLYLVGRSGLTLDGTGARIVLRTSGGNDASAFFIQGSSRITIRGFSVDGGNPATGSPQAWGYLDEHLNAAAVRAGSSAIEFDRVSWDNMRGFGVFVSADGGTVWPTGVSVHDSFIRGAECGLCLVAGNNVTFTRNTVNDSMGAFVDLEPDSSQSGGGGFNNVVVSDNDVSRFAWNQVGTSWFLGSVPQDAVVSTAVMNGLTVTGNRVWQGPATALDGNYPGMGGLGLRANKANPKSDYVIADNWTATASTGPSCVMYLANVHNLTVTGNTQPIANGGALVCDSGTTGTRTVGGNHTAP